MYSIGTLANKNAFHDLKVFLFTLQLWNDILPNVYIYCDSFIKNALENENLYKGKLFIKNGLDAYTNFDRIKMEQLPGKEFPSLFGDFVCEKMNLLNWIFETENEILFCDADICFLGPLPVLNSSKKLILSRHMIREDDEKRYGIYNAGFLYLNDKTVPNKWKTYTKSSSFFEQKSMEDLAFEYSDSFDEFSIQNNYGWWRLFQGEESLPELQKQWSIKRDTTCSGIYVLQKPLLSIHTHWKTNDYITKAYNMYILNYLEKLQSNNRTKKLVSFLKN